MKDHHTKRRAINLLTGILSLLIVFGVVTMVLYFWPRKIVEPTYMQTTLTEYRVGDTVFVKGHTTIHINGRVDNVVTLQCGIATYQIRTISFPVTKQDTDYQIPIGDIPDGVGASPPKCKVVSFGTYYFKYFLNFERAYTVTITSNDFIIIK
jgi:hypothetical protein